MSWLDEELDRRMKALAGRVIAGTLPVGPALLEIKAAYWGGFEDGSRELEATRRLLREAVTELTDLRGACEEAKA